MLEKITKLLKEVESFSIKEPGELESFRLKFLSKKGIISALFEDFRDVPVSEKKEIGRRLNLLKTTATKKYDDLKSGFSTGEEEPTINDMTRPSHFFNTGSRHPISIVRNEIIDIFERLGFTVSEGPEIENDDHVFTKLNFAPEHPARDMQDTFYISRINRRGFQS